MKVKIDTKEKFYIFTPEEVSLSGNMTEELVNKMLATMNTEPYNVILNMQHVTGVDDASAESLAQTQQEFYEANQSMVICCLEKSVEKFLDDKELLERMNVTPTESEAWDIVQMEEIEREFL